MMRKLAGKLVGLFVFLSVFCVVTVAVILVSTGVVDPYAFFPGLPEPPQIDTGDLPLPQPDLSGIEIPEELQGEVIVLGEQVTRRRLVARIPAPQQLSAEPAVISTNISYAVIMALIFGVCSTILGNMLRDEEPRIRAWLQAFGLDKVVAWVTKAFQWTADRSVKRGCLTLPIVAVILALYGIIFAFLEQGTSILSQQGAFLAVIMAFSVGLVSFSGDLARRLLGWFWRTDSSFHLYPVNIVVAIITVLFSRILVLAPGIAFGTPGGVEMEFKPHKRAARERTLAFATIGMVLFFGIVGWLLSGVVFSMLALSVDSRVAGFATTLLTIVQNTGLILYFVAIETVFFEMLPISYTDGRTIFNWSPLVWGIVFVPVMFLFNHTLLNPASGFLDSFNVSNVRFMWAFLLILIAVTGGLWFYFNMIDDLLRDWLGIRLPGDNY